MQVGPAGASSVRSLACASSSAQPPLRHLHLCPSLRFRGKPRRGLVGGGCVLQVQDEATVRGAARPRSPFPAVPERAALASPEVTQLPLQAHPRRPWSHQHLSLVPVSPCATPSLAPTAGTHLQPWRGFSPAPPCRGMLRGQEVPQSPSPRPAA